MRAKVKKRAVGKSISALTPDFKLKPWRQFGRDGVTSASSNLLPGTAKSQAHPSQCGKEFQAWRREGERLHERDSGCNLPTAQLTGPIAPPRRLVRAHNHPGRSQENPAKFAVLPSQIAGGYLKRNRSDARGLVCATSHRPIGACRCLRRAPVEGLPQPP